MPRQHLSHLLISMPLLILSGQVQTKDCEPTPHRTTGTHYEPVTMQKTNISEGMLVRGQVLAMPDCKPVANAKVAHWQAGEDGRYQNKLRAYLFTDEKGRFKFKTEWPDLTPPHMHFIVTVKGYDTLETQWIGDERKKEINFTMVMQK